MIDSLIRIVYFCDVTPSSDWDNHSPNFEFLQTLPLLTIGKLVNLRRRKSWAFFVQNYIIK